MSANQINEDNPVLTGVFAHYCGPWEWERYTRDLFAERGYDMLNPDLPIWDEDVSYDDMAAIVRAAQQERGAREYIDIGHSWGGDLIYRQIGAAPVSMLVFIGAPLRPVLEAASHPEDRNSRGILYHALVRAEESGVTEFDQDAIGQALFHGIGNTVLTDWATSQLRPHPHKKKLAAQADPAAFIPQSIATHYIGLENDYIFKYASQERTAKLLGMDLTSLKTGHFPMLEDPQQLVNETIGAIEAKKDQREEALDDFYASTTGS